MVKIRENKHKEQMFEAGVNSLASWLTGEGDDRDARGRARDMKLIVIGQAQPFVGRLQALIWSKVLCFCRNGNQCDWGPAGGMEKDGLVAGSAMSFEEHLVV